MQFALVAAPFIGLLLASLQVFLLSFAQQYLESAAEDAGRLILTGKVQRGVFTQASFKTFVCGDTSFLLSCNKLMVDVQVADGFASVNTGAPAIAYDQNGNATNQWSWNPGTAGNIVVMRLMYPWPVFNVPGLSLVNQSNNTHLIMATAVFKNESYN